MLQAIDPSPRHDLTDPNDGHRCGLCGKAFERRDLRDRHKRRCMLTFAKPKRSKRRSCLACAVSKLGCDQGQPSCHRCSSRNIMCEYAADAPTASSSVNGDGDSGLQAAANVMQQSNDREQNGLNNMEGIDDINMVSEFQPTQPQTLSVSSGHQQMIQDWCLDVGGGGSAGASYSLVEDSTFQMSPPSGDQWLRYSLDKDRLDFTALWNSNAVRSPEAGANGHDNRQQLVLDDRQRISTSQKEATARNRVPVMSADDMVKLVQSYLPMMTSRDSPAPPFIHDQIYQCNAGDVKEPIARAMICIQAFGGAMPSGRSFVYDMINKERDSLVRSFRSCKDDVDTLATIHAMVVLQVLGFFSDNVDQVRSAELHQPFLLKMVRKVTPKHRHHLVDNSANTARWGWRHWTFIETLRRTAFIVHSVNVMSARLQKQSPFYYEAVDDELILDMPLPAHPTLWEAHSDAQWTSLRNEALLGRTTGRQVQQEYASVPNDSDTFTNMVIASLIVDDLPST